MKKIKNKNMLMKIEKLLSDGIYKTKMMELKFFQDCLNGTEKTAQILTELKV